MYQQSIVWFVMKLKLHKYILQKYLLWAVIIYQYKLSRMVINY